VFPERQHETKQKTPQQCEVVTYLAVEEIFRGQPADIGDFSARVEPATNRSVDDACDGTNASVLSQ